MPKPATEQVKKILSDYEKKPSAFWMGLQKKNIWEIFGLAGGVLAYQKFLKLQGIDYKKIKSYADIEILPAVSKPNYFRKFGLKEVALPNTYEKSPLVMTATSGSTGLPTYFPRDKKIDWQYSVLADFFLSARPSEPTLLINCFGMGVWIGGVITYQAFYFAAQRGRPVTVITPGINKKEIFHALRELAPRFKYVIMSGYPPFIKDLLDEAKGEKVDFGKFNLRLLFAAESFTENFRDYVCAKGKIKNPFLDTLNIYGSAELGAMAFETPGSILIRRLALKNEKIFNSLFPLGGSPTLAQYNPAFVSFEQQNEKILISAKGPVPFLRYDIGDTGGIYTLEIIDIIFKEHKVNLRAEAKKLRIKLLNLPFVYVHVRSDFATKLYGAIIHPEPVAEALQHKKFKNLLSGKFTMATKADNKHNQFLEINLEMLKGNVENKNLAELAKKSIMENLLKKNAEYKNNYQSIPKKVVPVIKLWPYENPEYFKPGIKQKWVIK